MDRNILEVIRWRKKVVNLSAVAFIGAISVFGVPHAIHAMHPSPGLDVRVEENPQENKNELDTMPKRRRRSEDTKRFAPDRGTVQEFSQDDKALEGSTRNVDDEKKMEVEDQRADVAAKEKMEVKRQKIKDQRAASQAYKEGIKYCRKGNFKEAEKYFEDAFEKREDYGDKFLKAHYYLGWIYLKDKVGEKAKEHFTRVLSIVENSRYVEKLFMYGCLLMDQRLENLGVLKVDKKKAFNLIERAFAEGFGIEPARVKEHCDIGTKVGYNAKVIEYCEKKLLEKSRWDWLKKETNYFRDGVTEKTLPYFEKEANLGLAEAQFCLGEYFMKLEQQEKGIEWYKKAAELRHAEANFRLGEYFMKLEQQEKGIEWYKKAAELRHAEANFRLGEYFMKLGQQEEGIKWYKKAAELRHAEANFRLGEYFMKLGQQEEGIRWYKKAEKKGHAEASLWLGKHFIVLGNPNDEEAIRYLKPLAEQGCVEVQLLLGKYFMDKGNGETDSDKADNLYNEAVCWYEKAVLKNNDEARFRLGNYYFKIKNDPKVAIDYYRKAANNGYIEAQLAIEKYYFEGTGVKKNEIEAFYWFDQAANQEGIGALRRLRNYSLEEKVYSWYESAIYGDAEAQFNLGKYFMDKETQLKLSNDEVKLEEAKIYYKLAFSYYEKAANKEHKEAQFYLGEYYRKGYIVSQNYEKAVKWYKKSALQGYAPAQDILGRCYFEGIGVEQNENEALKWYQKAADQGHAEAKCVVQIYYSKGEDVKAEDISKYVVAAHEVKEWICNLGKKYLKTDFQKAKKYFEKVVESTKEAHYYLFAIYYHEYYLYEWEGKENEEAKEKMKEHLEKAIEFRKEIHDKHEFVECILENEKLVAQILNGYI